MSGVGTITSVDRFQVYLAGAPHGDPLPTEREALGACSALLAADPTRVVDYRHELTVGVRPRLVMRATWPSLGDLLSAGAFRTLYCTGNALRVVDGAARGFTRGNMLEVMQGDGTLCGNVEMGDQLPANVTHWGRWYADAVPPSHNSFHGNCYNVSGNIQLVPGSYQNGWLKVGLTRDRNGTPFPSPFNWFFLQGSLPKHRYEWKVEYVDAPGSMPAKVRIWPYVYAGWSDSAPLVFTAQHFLHTGQTPTSLQAFYDAGNVIGVDNVHLARRFALGQEGNGSAQPGGSMFIGDAALALDGPVGTRTW